MKSTDTDFEKVMAAKKRVLNEAYTIMQSLIKQKASLEAEDTSKLNPNTQQKIKRIKTEIDRLHRKIKGANSVYDPENPRDILIFDCSSPIIASDEEASKLKQHREELRDLLLPYAKNSFNALPFRDRYNLDSLLSGPSIMAVIGAVLLGVAAAIAALNPFAGVVILAVIVLALAGSLFIGAASYFYERRKPEDYLFYHYRLEAEEGGPTVVSQSIADSLDSYEKIQEQKPVETSDQDSVRDDGLNASSTGSLFFTSDTKTNDSKNKSDEYDSDTYTV